MSVYTSRESNLVIFCHFSLPHLPMGINFSRNEFSLDAKICILSKIDPFLGKFYSNKEVVKMVENMKLYQFFFKSFSDFSSCFFVSSTYH